MCTSPHILKHPLQCWTVGIAAGEAAIVIFGPNQRVGTAAPQLVRLPLQSYNALISLDGDTKSNLALGLALVDDLARAEITLPQSPNFFPDRN
jgi:hypothetical protein